MDYPISKYDRFCTGCISEPHEKYITGLILSVAKINRNFEHHGSKILDYICAFDRAEAAGVYIGQINMIYVSSFCSPGCYLWGYNIAKNKHCYVDHPLLKTNVINYLSHSIKIYSAEPLQNAIKNLFGTKDKKRFPLFPGTHIPVAGRNIEMVGPANLYAAIGIGISSGPDLPYTFMEDIGEIPLMLNDEAINQYKAKILTDIGKSVITVGIEQGISFKYVFVDIKHINIADNEVGSSLVAVPYFNIAKNAIPKGNFDQLIKISQEEWINEIK